MLHFYMLTVANMIIEENYEAISGNLNILGKVHNFIIITIFIPNNVWSIMTFSEDKHDHFTCFVAV
jgi:hypothetical protein